MELFGWHAYDARPLLPSLWQRRLLEIAGSHGVNKELIPTSVTSRESRDVQRIPVTTVGGIVLSEAAPWLSTLYHSEFRQLAARAFRTEVQTAMDPRIGINLNVQQGQSQRYEAHVDSNPIEGLLYVTDHPPGSGGELVVANNSEAVGVRQIETDCSIIYPVAGHIVFFDAREHPHFVRPLRSMNSTRVVVAMNFFTSYCTEAERPADLNRHLFGSNQ